ncbi:MAG: hypothetical protein WDZ62_02585 [Candidatus Pacearchaeota archaeon]
MKLKNKKKGSHVGIMLSFVMFVMFVFFIYMIVQPSLSNQETGNFIEGLETIIFDQASIELKTISVKLNTLDDSCVELNNFLDEVDIDKRVVAKDSEDSSLIVGNSGSSSDLGINSNGKTFFRIYHSDEFEIIGVSLSDCDSLDLGTGYEIGLLKSDKIIFEPKIENILQEYEDNPNSFKSELNISEENEFSLGFIYSNGTSIIVGEENLPETSIYLDKILVKYIDEDGSIKLGYLRIGTW